MARLTAPILALALGAVAALALVSCGGSDAKLLPGNTAQEINENLDSVQQLVDEGECVDAEDEALQVSTQVEGLTGIDEKLKQNLKEGAERLTEVVESCTEATTETFEEESIPTTTETTTTGPKKEKPEKKAEPPEKTEAEPPTKEPAEKAPPPAPPGKAKGHEETPVGPEEGDSGGIGPGSAVNEAEEGEG